VKGCGTTTSGFQDFNVSNTKPQCTTTLELQKVKGCGTTSSGFWDFDVSNTKPQYMTIPEFRNHKDLSVFPAQKDTKGQRFFVRKNL
jgi:hypothetical protein